MSGATSAGRTLIPRPARPPPAARTAARPARAAVRRSAALTPDDGDETLQVE